MSVMEISRGAGDRPGPDISDPLLTHPDAIRARGTHELDAATSGTTVRVDGHFTGRIPAPGEMREFVDDKGRRRRGMIDEVEVILTRSDLSTFAADCNLTIEAER